MTPTLLIAKSDGEFYPSINPSQSIYSRPGLIFLNFSTTHFPGPIVTLIKMPEGFYSKMTL